MNCNLFWNHDKWIWVQNKHTWKLKTNAKYYSVLQSTTYCSTTKYFSSSTKYYSSATPYYKASLLQYYKVLLTTVLQTVLQSIPSYYKVLLTTPVQLCTTKCYSGTTLCYKVLIQKYYSTPVLLCPRKNYSNNPILQSIASYYKVLLQ